MTFNDNTSGLTPQRQMTFKHNSSELRTHDNINEPSSSKLVPDVSPTAEMTDTSLQGLELLFSPMYEEYFTTRNKVGKEAVESSLRNVDTSNMHTFYQRHHSEDHWTKDHPLEQVCGDPSKLVQTR
ncbi:hypothetical protein Tco_0896515 [Tanacetum coccineum]